MIGHTSMRAGLRPFRLASRAACLGSVAFALGACQGERSRPAPAEPAPSGARASNRAALGEQAQVSSAPDAPTASEASDTERPLSVPSGDPPRVTCAQARAIVAEV